MKVAWEEEVEEEEVEEEEVEETTKEETEDVWGGEGSLSELDTLAASASVSLGRFEDDGGADDVGDGSVELGKASSWGHGNSNVGITSSDWRGVVTVSKPAAMFQWKSL